MEKKITIKKIHKIKKKNVNATKSRKLKFNIKRKVFNNFNVNIKNFEFFNNICGNVFKNYLSVGKRSHNDIKKMIQKYLGNFECLILIFLLDFESGRLTIKESFEFLKKNPIVNNIYYFLTVLKTEKWQDFCKFSENINFSKKKKKKNLTLITLETLKKIVNLKNLLNSLINGDINEEHFKISIKKYKFNKNLSSILLDQDIVKYFDNINFSNNDINIHNIFLNNTIGFYDAVISKYTKYFVYSQADSKDNLSLFLKKYRWIKLNAAKNSDTLSYIHALALSYIGNPLKLAFAPKPINLRYRAYRIFLYSFKLKPFKLWQLTRKSRKYKYGGLLADHLAKYELTIENMLLLSNFCLSLQQVKDYLKNRFICVNDKIVVTTDFVIKPFDVITFISDLFREERDKFLLNLASAIYKNIFTNEFSKLFEYNFKSFNCLLLPGFFINRKSGTAPYYTIYNGGRFKIQKK